MSHRTARFTEAKRVTEATDRIAGRVLEAKGTDDSGGRVFRMLVIAPGDSRNGRRYPEAVLRAATPLYSGAKVYDHHRTEAELTTSTISGLVGSLRNVEATTAGIEADLHLLPSATHTAEALDASLAAQENQLPPLVGMSHDVYAQYRPLVHGGKRLQEATLISKVNSADVVADPAAGGRVTRMVAGGSVEPDPEEGQMKTLKEVLALLRAAKSQEEYDSLVTEHKSVLDESGLVAAEDAPFVAPVAAPEPAPAPAPEPEPALVGATEALVFERSTVLGGQVLRGAVEAAGFTGDNVGRVVEAVAPMVPAKFKESDLAALMTAMKPNLDRLFMAPTVPDVQVTQEAHDRKIQALDAMFEGTGKGYHSFKQAFFDVTGTDPRAFFALGSADENRSILRECFGAGWDSAQRSTESLDTTSWAQVLGDSITRRMVTDYALPQLNTWRPIVSDFSSVNDFRTQRRVRIGGYGTLPVVNEGAPYQPLTSPPDEEVTYALEKKGGTEDLTLEMIANDDLAAIRRIPQRLGRAAGQTLYRFAWDLLATNPTIYDSTALFAAGHSNTTTSAALSQSTLSARRTAMRRQAAYGDASEILGLVPKYLVVPPDLEEIAYQLANSAVAVPASGSSSDMPNIHQNLQVIVVDYWSDTNDWFVIADPALAPTIEIGFYQGRQEPELFTQTDPTVGAVFSADKITWKIRFVFKGAVLDYRPFQRAQG